MPKQKRTIRQKQTSRELFLQFTKIDSFGNVDTSKIFEKECYNAWLALRRKTPKRPAESYRRSLVAQVTASDGRKPFSPEVEKSVLKRLREGKPWPCFAGTKTKIGRLGLKRLGYHEKERLRQHSQKTTPTIDSDFFDGMSKHVTGIDFSAADDLVLSQVPETDITNVFPCPSKKVSAVKEEILDLEETTEIPTGIDMFECLLAGEQELWPEKADNVNVYQYKNIEPLPFDQWFCKDAPVEPIKSLKSSSMSSHSSLDWLLELA
mmetsp:Transcript_2054/g.2366  ORF Transcript_2054/g.2366 Transcript_2054/m.2366 type:complete len:264 (-) Transcript_2054:116-907(-)